MLGDLGAPSQQSDTELFAPSISQVYLKTIWQRMRDWSWLESVRLGIVQIHRGRLYPDVVLYRVSMTPSHQK